MYLRFGLFFSLIFSLFANVCMSQTGPGGVGNSTTNEIWLPVEGNCFTDAGITLGVNTSNIQQWNDVSGNANNAIQTNNSFKPNLNTNALNGFSTLTFNGSTDRILSSGVTSNNQVTIFVVVQFNNLTNNNDGIIQAGPTGTAFSTTTSNKSIGMWINTSNGRIWGRGIQSNNSQRNISQTTILSTGQFYIITQDFNGTSINQYVDGTAAGTVTYNNTLKSWSDFGIGRQANESLDGDLAEMIVHRVSLNSAERIITENYLSAKYGLSLSANDIYNEDNVGNGNYDFEVAGIGRVDASNIHNDAQGTGMVRVLNPTGLQDDEFLIWGHDNGLAQAQEYTDVPAGVQARFVRVWRVSEANSSGSGVNVGNIDMRWDLSNLGAITASDLRLLIDTDNDGVFADETPIGGATSLGGNIYQFANVPGGATGIRNNRRFTIATADVSETPLPIDLLSFDVNVNGNKIDLSWITASEINNDYFTVQKSKNGVDWEDVLTVNGAGNSSQTIHYFDSDYSPYSGLSYYRLKQTDFDGKTSYSSIVPVKYMLDNTGNISLFPNPIEGGETLQISFKDIKEEEVLVVLRDIAGKEFYSKLVLEIEDEKLVGLPIDKVIPKGIYIVTATSENQIYNQKLIVK